MREEVAVYHRKQKDGAIRIYTGHRDYKEAIAIEYQEGKAKAFHRAAYSRYYEAIEYPTWQIPSEVIESSTEELRKIRELKRGQEVRALQEQLELLVDIAKAHAQQETFIQELLPQRLRFHEIEVGPFEVRSIGKLVDQGPGSLLLIKDDPPRGVWRYEGGYRQQTFSSVSGKVLCHVIFSPYDRYDKAIAPPSYPDYIYTRCRIMLNEGKEDQEYEPSTVSLERKIHNWVELEELLREAMDKHMAYLKGLVGDLRKLQRELSPHKVVR